MKRFFYLMAVALLFASCGHDDSVAGGGSSGTEAGNAIMARVITDDSEPAAGVPVHLMSSDAISGVDADAVSQDTVTDSSGSFVFRDLPEGKYTIEVLGSHGALQFSAKLSGEEGLVDRGVDTLGDYAYVKGRLDSGWAGGTVTMLGLKHSAEVREDGSFSLDSLPEGACALVYVPSVKDTLRYAYVMAEAGTSVEAPSFAAEDRSLLLEDFEDGDSRHRLGPYEGGGWWFISTGPEVTVSPDSAALQPLFPVVLSDNGTEALHFSVNVPNAAASSWANCGVQIGENDSSYDFSAVDSIAFLAKGSGSFYLELLGPYAETEESGSSAETLPQKFISLVPQWKRYSIAVADMKGTELQISHVRVLSWVFTRSAELWLDNVELIGASKEEIWK